MIPVEDRRAIVANLDEARAAGSRLAPACELIGVDPRTIQRWRRENGLELGDRRPHADRPKPMHALSDAEREEILEVANSDRFADVPPARIVPALADEGRYIASESSFYRVLRDADQVRHRGRSKAPERRKPPSTHTATAPNELWTWDMTYLPASVVGRWFYLYLILDVFSRKIVGFEVHDTDASEHAAHLLKRTALAEGIAAREQGPVLHGDNGATLKGTTVLAMMHWLGVKPSYSRPRVSNDNAFVESLFRTAKYRPEYPTRPFATLDEARAWAARFVRWYNTEHRHSGIRYVTPEQRHSGHDVEILTQRHRTYEAARAANPRRWSGRTRDWSVIDTVTLNPERADIELTSEQQPISRTVA